MSTIIVLRKSEFLLEKINQRLKLTPPGNSLSDEANIVDNYFNGQDIKHEMVVCVLYVYIIKLIAP